MYQRKTSFSRRIEFNNNNPFLLCISSLHLLYCSLLVPKHFCRILFLSFFQPRGSCFPCRRLYLKRENVDSIDDGNNNNTHNEGEKQEASCTRKTIFNKPNQSKLHEEEHGQRVITRQDAIISCRKSGSKQEQKRWLMKRVRNYFLFNKILSVTSNHELVVGENLVQQETSYSLSTSSESIDNKSREISVKFRHKYRHKYQHKYQHKSKPDKELGISKESK